jgi:DNA-binding MarR family transcriptional regulator
VSVNGTYLGEDMRKKQIVIDNIMDNIRRVFQILNEQSQRIKQETGLTGPQLWAIRVIHQSGPINISDIAKRMYLHQTTVLGIIDRLEARGLVSRNRSKDDRRIIWVELTQGGNNLVKSVPEVVHGLLGANLESISLNDLAEIDAGISQLVKIYGVQEIQPKPLFSIEVNKKKKKGGGI